MSVNNAVAKLSRTLAHTRFRRVSSALFRYFPAKKGTIMINDFDRDLSMSLDRSSYIGSSIYWRGYHSHLITDFLADFLKPGMTIVDVGANIGEITLFAAKRVENGRVLAFEPMPDTFVQLAHNVKLNRYGTVKLFNYGLYDHEDTLPIYSKKDELYGTTNHGVPSLFHDAVDRLLCSVPLRKFDDIACEESLSRLDVMKIDVEGAELMVLRGAEAALKEFRPVLIVEISERNFSRAGYTSSELYAYMQSLEYDHRALCGAPDDLGLEDDALFVPREKLLLGERVRP